MVEQPKKAFTETEFNICFYNKLFIRILSEYLKLYDVCLCFYLSPLRHASGLFAVDMSLNAGLSTGDEDSMPDRQAPQSNCYCAVGHRAFKYVQLQLR